LHDRMNQPGDVIVVDYDPEWPRVFDALQSSLWRAVADVATAIEHIGSTSVPGLAAKPIIDMDVVVPDGGIGIGIARLRELGYEHQGNLGIPQREAFKRPPEAPRHHLYLCPSSSPALANHLAVRDYLRANPSAALAYGELKKRLAREHARDIDGYIEGKTSFLVGILREVGFAEGAIVEIERMNRKPPR
jgi:GrpB-like predicted nucleotidyltransferase (UPF0157 family)